MQIASAQAMRDDLRTLLAEAVAARATAEAERDQLRDELRESHAERERQVAQAQQQQRPNAMLAATGRAEAASLAAELAKTQQRAREGRVDKLCLQEERRRRQELEAALEGCGRMLEAQQVELAEAKARAEQLAFRWSAAAEAVDAVASGWRTRAEAALAATAAAMAERADLERAASAVAAAEERLREEREARAAAEASLASAHADIVQLKLQRAQAEFEHAEKAAAIYSKMRTAAEPVLPAQQPGAALFGAWGLRRNSRTWR